MQARVESGLSITKFCEREGMHVNRYHYWQRRLRCTAIKELEAAQPEIAQLPPAGWAQVRAAEETEKTGSSEVTIEIGKCRITANESVPSELLTKVCKVLVELC